MRENNNICNNVMIYMEKCSKWRNQTFSEFLNCKHNLANNRQTRMLANFNTLGCGVMKCVYQTGSCSQKMKQLSEMKLLESAKHTLISLAFFGLAEYPIQSEYLFLKTFNEKKFRFNQSFKIESSLNSINYLQFIKRIEEKNQLDIEFYKFAKKMFLKRLDHYHQKAVV